MGALLAIAGLATSVHTIRLVIPGALFLTLGAQTNFASFFMSVLGLRWR